MAKPVVRIGAVQFAFALGITAVVARSAQLQIHQRAQWVKEAVEQRTEHRVLPARRGTLYDRNGVPLAITQEFYHLGIAPNELENAAVAVRLVAEHLDVPSATLQRDLRTGKRWIYLHGPFTATQVQPIRELKGMHLEGEFRRFNPSRDLAHPILGGLAPGETAGGSGLELALDSLLSGRPGEAVLLKDPVGTSEILGIVLILAGVWVVNRQTSRLTK